MTKTEITTAIETLKAATAAKLVEVNAEYAGRNVANLDEIAWGRVLQDVATRDLARKVLDNASARQLRSLGFTR